MNFSIDGLEGYFGGKGSSGVPQQIINIIPPHDNLIIPFLGHCAITRTIKPAKKSLLFEKCKSTFDSWQVYFSKECGFYFREEGAYIFVYEFYIDDACYELNNSCGILYLENWMQSEHESSKPVIYCDPPYLLETRLSNNRYAHEMTQEDHERFLNAVTKINSPVLVSHYKNDMYDNFLKNWNTINFMSQTRSGKPRRETVYFNYDKPEVLHDFRFYGNNYKIRENNKLKAARLVARFERMKPLEKNYYINALIESGVIANP